MIVSDQTIRNEALNPAKSFIVEAPAGSGKTALLVKRFLKLLEVARPDSILAITFTRKAAAEMKARILTALDGKRFELNIMTIDAFCRQIVMRLPLEAEILGMNMLEDEAALKADLCQSLLDAIETDEEGAADLIHVFQHFDNNLELAVTQLLTLLKNREEWLPLILQQETQTARLDWLATEVLEAIHSKTNHIDQTVIEIKKLVPELFTQKWTIRQTVPEHLQALKQKLLESPSLCEHYIHIAHLPDLDEAAQPILAVLLRVLPLIAAHLQVVLLKRQETDYHEVALKALTMLQDPNNGILASLDREIEHILVDEFQDTSKLQFQLLKLLTQEWQPHSQRSVFFVGDPKQSIYRFRNADVSLFLEVKEKGLNQIHLKPLQLTQNFRTSQNLLAWINQTCTQFFPQTEDKRLGAIPYTISAGSQAAVNTPVVVQEHETEGDEANWIAKQIQSLQTDSASIAILVRARSHYPSIIAALEAAGLAYAVKEDRRWLSSTFVDDLIALLYAIHHPADRLAWLSLLHSPFCGWSITQIQTFLETEASLWSAWPDLQKVVFSTDLPYLKFNRAIQTFACTLSETELMILKRFEMVLLELDHLPSLSDFQALLERYDFGEPVAADSAIQLLTIHQAKGLEFDTVFLPALQKRVGRDDTPLLYTETFYSTEQFRFLLAERPAKGAERSSLYNYLHWLETKRSHFETMRLLYVAMTRAKSHLVLSYSGERVAKGSFLQLLKK